MSELVLREYQAEAVKALNEELERVNSTLLVASVGAGKTIMQAAFIKGVIDRVPDARFVCAVHTRELVVQNYQAMVRAWPFAPVGINSAALKRRDFHSQILFCSIQSVHRRAEQIGFVDGLIVDECHLISPKSETMYRSFIDALRGINPDMRIVGMSGTPFRMDSGELTDGDAALFETVAYEIGVAELINMGYLTRPISKGTAMTFDMTGVHTRGGEYIPGEAERAVNKTAVTEAAVDEIVSYGQNRKKWLCFCAGVAHAEATRDVIRSRGISCETVEGSMSASDRRRILQDFKDGKIRCVTNVNCLTTGFDDPGIDLVALMRPTKSASLYVQMVGRGIRLHPDKENCLILDFANVVRTLGPIDQVVVRKPGTGDGEAPCKMCPECDAIWHTSAKVCHECGYEFPESETPFHEATADSVKMLSTDDAVWEPVSSQEFETHLKAGMPPSVKVTYFTPKGKSYSTWVCPQHGEAQRGRFAKANADRWWMNNGGRTPYPATVSEFLERAGELSKTSHITVSKSNGYWNVTGTKLSEDESVDYTPPPERAGNLVPKDRWQPPADFLTEDEIPF